MVPVVAEKFSGSPEIASTRLLPAVPLPLPLSLSRPSWKAEPPLSITDDCVPEAVLPSVVVALVKNWIAPVLLLTGVPPPHDPCGALNQLSVEAGTPLTLPSSHV
jgi:hypothetical protein